jgi:fructose-1,6-bisphosphatase
MNTFEILKNCSGVVEGKERHFKAGEMITPNQSEVKQLSELVYYGFAKIVATSQKNKVTKVVRPSKTK